jgi:hypothetical protein
VIHRFFRWLTARQPAPDCTYMVRHHCPVDGAMEIEAGAPCNWCGKTEPVPMPAVFRSNRRAG